MWERNQPSSGASRARTPVPDLPPPAETDSLGIPTLKNTCAITPLRAILAAAGAISLLPAIASHGTALAAGYYVSTGGSDSNAGTLARPWRTFQVASNRLRAGDTLYVRAGTYFERPNVSATGTAATPIVIRSYPGESPIIDSGVPDFRTPGNADWEPVDAALGEYRSVRTFTLDEHVYAQIAGINGYVNDRVVLVPYTSAAAFRSTSEAYVDGTTPFYIGPGTFWDPADNRFHIRLAKTADLRATESRYGPIFAAEQPDPRQFSIVLSHAYSTLTVTGSYLVFQGLTVNQAVNSIYLLASAHHVVLDGVTVWLGDSAIEMRGAHDVKIVNSRVYGDAPYWIFWSDMKDAPAPADLLRATSIDLREGTHDVEISHCHIRGSGQDLIGINNNEYNVSVHHCRIENGGDDAFEIEGTVDVGRVSIYENFILNCLTAVAPGQDTPAFTGPLYFYRNVVAILRNPPVNRKVGINSWNGGARYWNEYMFKHGASASYSTRNAHYYQNTLVMLNSAGKGLNWIPKDPTDCRIANNLAVMIDGVVSRDYRAAAGELVDGNLYWKVNSVDTEPLLASHQTVAAFSAATGFEAHGLGSAPRRGTDARFVSWQPDVVDRTRTTWELRPGSEIPRITDFLLRSDSPARGAAVAIPPHPTFGAFPDSRSSRDLGAIPFGTAASEFEVFPYAPDGPLDTVPPGRPVITIKTR